MIQEATIEDLEAISLLAFEFIESSPYKNIYSKDKTIRVIEDLINNPNNLVIYYEEDSSTLHKHNNNAITKTLEGDKENIDSISSSKIITTNLDRYDIEDSHSIITYGDRGVINNNSFRVIKGFLLGITNEFLLSTDKLATELAWYVSPLYRNAGVGRELLLYFEEWSKRKGCKGVIMISLNKEVGELYNSLGYKLTERTYMKEI